MSFRTKRNAVRNLTLVKRLDYKREIYCPPHKKWAVAATVQSETKLRKLRFRDGGAANFGSNFTRSAIKLFVEVRFLAPLEMAMLFLYCS